MAESYRVEKWAEHCAPNGAMLRMKMEQSGYRVFQWSDQPGAFYGLHKHPEAQSHWVISGSLEIVVASGSYLLEAGDRDFMPAETYHTARVVGEKSVLYLVGELYPPAPAKRKRGRPKKVKPEAETDEELPPEVIDLLSRFGIER
jgi:mannose-6-phosphate isomerase-like protein (cupin superfamily)